MHAYFWLVEHHKFIVRGYDHVENCIYIYIYIHIGGILRLEL